MNETAVGNTTDVSVARSVLIKLVMFSLSLGLFPITSYFASQKYLWNGNSTYAAITAVVSANVVLVAYIISSILEDKSGSPGTSQEEPLPDSKKRQ